MMKMTRLGQAGLLLVIAGSAMNAAKAATTYKAQALPQVSLASPGPFAFLNDGSTLHGAVTRWGSCTPPLYCTPPALEMEVRHTAIGGTTTPLPQTQRPAYDIWSSQSFGVSGNHHGQILFWPRTAQGEPAELWQDGTRQPLPPMLSDDRQGSWTWLSDSGALLGQQGDTLYLNQLGTTTSIPTPASFSRLRIAGINATNAIAVTGTATAGTSTRALLWSGSSYKVLPFPIFSLHRSASAAIGLNDTGDVVGSISNSQGLTRAALWRGGWGHDLGTLPGFRQGASLAVSSTGVVLACAYNDLADATDTGRLFVWEKGVRRPLTQIAAPTDARPELAAALERCKHLVAGGPYAPPQANQTGQFLLRGPAVYVLLTP